jgi:hypothetical protein
MLAKTHHCRVSERSSSLVGGAPGVLSCCILTGSRLFNEEGDMGKRMLRPAGGYAVDYTTLVPFRVLRMTAQIKVSV